MSTWNFEYKYIAAGKVSRPATVAVETTPEEAAVIKDAEANWRPMAKEPGLKDLIARATEQIRTAAAAELCAQGDEFAAQCAKDGKSPFDEGYRLTVKICDPDDEI